MAISEESIRRVKEATDILDVIGDFVQLKKKGQNWFGLSPFQDEKTPSFSVSPSRGIFKDFSSGKAGDAISFLMEHEGLGYLEAIRYLAKKYGIELEETQSTEEDRERSSELESLHIALNFARDYFTDQLKNTPEGRGIGLSYFRERGFSEKSIEKFELGYSRPDWDAFLKHAEKHQFTRDILDKAGLIISKEEKVYDRYRGRVIFPIHNMIGKVVGFGARTLSKDKNQPKYINSPETPVYNKSKELYGLYFSKNAIRNLDNCILVEGYTDVISLHQAGIENVIASSGTSLTEEQIKTVKRFTRNLTLIFDGDEAGLKASERGLKLVLKGGLNVHVVVLPEGADPDSFVRANGGQAFNTFLEENKQDFLSFKTRVGLKEIGKDPFKKAGLIREIVETIVLIPDPITRSVYFKACSQLLEIDEHVLITEYNKITRKEHYKQFQKSGYQEDKKPFKDPIQDDEHQVSKSTVRSEENEKEILKYLILFSNVLVKPDNILIGQYLLDSIDDVDFTNPEYNKILNIYQQFSNSDRFPEFQDIQHNEEYSDIRDKVIDIISERHTVSENWEKQNIFVPSMDHNLTEKVFSDINRLKWRKVKELKESTLEELKILSEGDADEAEYQKLLRYFNELKKIEKSISDELGNVIS